MSDGAAMTSLRPFVLLVGLTLVSLGCDDDPLPPPPDSGTVMPSDAGDSMDAAAPMDAGLSEDGAVVMDAGPVEEDAGPREMDAGTAATDGGTAATDAGRDVMEDAGTSMMTGDAGPA